MTFTFTNAGSGRKDMVRVLIGDTDSTAPLLQDEDINALLLHSTSDWSVASEACMTIASKLARDVRSVLGPLREEGQQRYEHYVSLAERYAAIAGIPVPAEAGAGGAAPGRVRGLLRSQDPVSVPFFTRTRPQ